MTGNETPFAARVAVVLKLPSTQHNSYRRGAPRDPANACVGLVAGRDRAVRVVQPPLPMLDQRRHDWQRNTFRCTCCCCSQITKYPTQLVPPWRAQGSGLTRVGGILWARQSGTRVQPPLPMLDQRRHDWQRNTFRCTCCCCSQITKYPTQLVPPWRAQGSGLTRVGQILWARQSGTSCAATLAHARPATT